MKKALLTLLLVLLHLSAIPNNYSSYSFLHITGDNGLSQSHVKAILKDSYGFMWFGTKNHSCLAVYKGQSFETIYSLVLNVGSSIFQHLHDLQTN